MGRELIRKEQEDECAAKRAERRGKGEKRYRSEREGGSREVESSCRSGLFDSRNDLSFTALANDGTLPVMSLLDKSKSFRFGI